MVESERNEDDDDHSSTHASGVEADEIHPNEDDTEKSTRRRRTRIMDAV